MTGWKSSPATRKGSRDEKKMLYHHPRHHLQHAKLARSAADVARRSTILTESDVPSKKPKIVSVAFVGGFDDDSEMRVVNVGAMASMVVLCTRCD
jgi:hypothetical protein